MLAADTQIGARIKNSRKSPHNINSAGIILVTPLLLLLLLFPT